jgi:hypothetical protein
MAASYHAVEIMSIISTMLRVPRFGTKTPRSLHAYAPAATVYFDFVQVYKPLKHGSRSEFRSKTGETTQP